ncbi:MAG: glycosyltransferase family 4 protein [Hyphomicrobiaceae bacterium]
MPSAHTSANAAIYFVPEAFTTKGPKLMGRNAAGESFLKGFARHAAVTDFNCFVTQRQDAGTFAEEIAAHGRAEPVRSLTAGTLPALETIGALHYPAPGLAEGAWHRALFGHHRWSLTGITHTTASARAMDGLVELLTAPVQPWDAIICTSTAVRDNVHRLFDAQKEYLAARLGATRFVAPLTPVIPLGINTGDFVFSDRDRQEARTAIGADADTIVVLFMGRLSFHAKAHPLAMYQALERAGRTLPPNQKIMLVECGWHANAAIGEAFADAAAMACPGVKTVLLDGRVPESRRTAWASADVFCSLSDNIQETFGLVPVEAMAAGLPCVVSDWNGYKDTVRDGIDGFRIPTLAPPPGAALEEAATHALGIGTYDKYCGDTCMLVSVDIGAAADAFRRLCADPGLRRRMGQAGRRQAQERYDWSAIVPRYQALWAELAVLRQKTNRGPVLRHPWPARMEPFSAFATYPTATLTRQTRLALDAPTMAAAVERLAAIEALDMVGFSHRTQPPPEIRDRILVAAARGPAPAGELIAEVAPSNQLKALRAVMRLTKLGILKVAH